jgi:hypothetical protein
MDGEQRGRNAPVEIIVMYMGTETSDDFGPGGPRVVGSSGGSSAADSTPATQPLEILEAFIVGVFAIKRAF